MNAEMQKEIIEALGDLGDGCDADGNPKNIAAEVLHISACCRESTKRASQSRTIARQQLLGRRFRG